MEPAEVAELALKALFKERRIKVTGFTNALGATFVRFLPRRLQASVSRRVLS